MTLNYRHIFIVTYGRSGSTLLCGILNAIPGVCIRGENANLLAPLRRAVETASWLRAMPAGADTPERSWYGSTLVDPQKFQEKLVAAFVADVLKPPEDAVAIGFKEMRYRPADLSEQEYDLQIEFLLGAFERPCILFNTRDHRDVARSAFWLSDPFAKKHLKQCEARFRRSLAKHPDATFAVDYDSLAGDPEALRPLFSFLGAPFDRAAIDAVLARRHGYHPTAKDIERFRAARSMGGALVKALIRRLTSSSA